MVRNKVRVENSYPKSGHLVYCGVFDGMLIVYKRLKYAYSFLQLLVLKQI